METEFCASGDLSHCLWPNRNSNYLEKIIKTISTELLLGLQNLHINGIIHCNLKPSNILIDEFGNVRICDFKKALRLNTMTQADIKKNKTAMTPCYTAPELFREDGSYTTKTDLWALGCIMYEMAAGHVPFFDEMINKLINKIITEEVNFNRKEFTNYSNEFLDVLKALLEKDPNQRAGWGKIEKFAFWEFDITNDSVSSINDNININININSFSNISENSNLQNDNTNATRLSSNSKQISYSSPTHNQNYSQGSNGSLLVYNNATHNTINQNKHSNIEVLGNSEEEYSNTNNKADDIESTDREFKFQGESNTSEESYSNSLYDQSKKSSGKGNNNTLEISVLNVNKIMSRDKRVYKAMINDIASSLAKSDDLPQIETIMIHQSDRIVKPIIGNKIIEPNLSITTYDPNKIPFRPLWKINKIKELIINDAMEQLERYLINLYQTLEQYHSKRDYSSLLNLLNYFETIILSKEVANKIINTSFVKLFIKFLDINNDQIRVRACSLIAFLIRYATSMDQSLDKYNLIEKFISFISDNNIELNRKAIATLGEYLFFVATQAEGDGEEEINLNSTNDVWTLSQDSLTALLYALNHTDEIVKFYALKTIENIVTLTTISKTYFASNDDFISKIIEIYNSDCENNEIKTSALSTISHIIRHEPTLFKVFIDKVDMINILIERETTKNQQFIINIILFGIAEKVSNINIVNFDSLIPSFIILLESSNSVIKGKIILILSLVFSETFLIIKYGEKVLALVQKLRKEKQQFYYYVKIFEQFMVNYCKNSTKYIISLMTNPNSKNQTDIISLLTAFNIIGPYIKISYSLFKPEFLECLKMLIYANYKDDNILKLSFDLIKFFSENAYSVEENIDYIISKLLVTVLNLSTKVSQDYKRFPLNICANILTVLLDDEKLYSSTVVEGIKTGQINSLIITILPTITELLKSEDTVNESLAFLSLIVERNSAFISFYRKFGIIDYIFQLMTIGEFYSNVNLMKILIKLIESNDTNFNDIINMNLIDKVNYMISKDSYEDITIYTEYVIEMFYDLMYKISETKKKYPNKFDKEDNKKSFISKIEKVALNFKLCIQLLGCENKNIQEKSCICLIFMLQFFQYGSVDSGKVNVKFSSEDIPDLLKGLDSNCKKIHTKMIKLFKWIIEYQDDAKNILAPYVSYVQIYVEKIRDTSTEPKVIDLAV